MHPQVALAYHRVDTVVQAGTVAGLMLTIMLNMATGYGLFIVKACVALAVMAGVAWVLVRYAGPRLRAGRGARMKVLERLPLEPRRSLYLVQVEGRKLLIGVSDGSVSLIDDAQDGQVEEVP